MQVLAKVCKVPADNLSLDKVCEKADVTVADIANKEQLSVSICYVCHGVTKEMFVDVERISSKALAVQLIAAVLLLSSSLVIILNTVVHYLQ